MNIKRFGGHTLAFFTMLLWGITFVVTRLLLDAGLGPLEILIYRFVLAYILLWIIHPFFQKPASLRTELLFLLAGASGVSVYYVLENMSLIYTSVANVSLLVTTAPLFTGLLAALLWRQRLSWPFFLGFVVSLCGVFLIVSGGQTLRLHPKGDLLALAAAASWAVYSLCLKPLTELKLHPLLLTRRIFFYGCLLFIPMGFVFDIRWHFTVLSDWRPVSMLAFLVIAASVLCYVLWNLAVKLLGTVTASAYIYLNPVTAIVAAHLLLDEKLGLLGLVGAVLVLAGLIVSNLPVLGGRKAARK